MKSYIYILFIICILQTLSACIYTNSGKHKDSSAFTDSIDSVFEDSVCTPLKKDCVTIAMVGDIMLVLHILTLFCHLKKDACYSEM